MRGLLFRTIADMRRPDSWITQLRRRRIAFFLELLSGIAHAPGRPLQLLDVGGTAFFWQMLGLDSISQTSEVCETSEVYGDATHLNAGLHLRHRPLHITLLNIAQPAAVPPNFTNLTGDGCAMPQFRDQQGDIVFSNSVIEHVGDDARQQAFAREVRRVGQRYFVQTPNRHFPIEPHFFFPGFQFLPLATRIWLVQHFALGWFPRIPDYAAARAEVEQIRLLTPNDMGRLFPSAHIQTERTLGLTVGVVAYEGWRN